MLGFLDIHFLFKERLGKLDVLNNGIYFPTFLGVTRPRSKYQEIWFLLGPPPDLYLATLLSPVCADLRCFSVWQHFFLS